MKETWDWIYLCAYLDWSVLFFIVLLAFVLTAVRVALNHLIFFVSITCVCVCVRMLRSEAKTLHTRTHTHTQHTHTHTHPHTHIHTHTHTHTHTAHPQVVQDEQGKRGEVSGKCLESIHLHNHMDMGYLSHHTAVILLRASFSLEQCVTRTLSLGCVRGETGVNVSPSLGCGRGRGERGVK